MKYFSMRLAYCFSCFKLIVLFVANESLMDTTCLILISNKVDECIA